MKLADGSGKSFAVNGMRVLDEDGSGEDDSVNPTRSTDFMSDKDPPARVDLRRYCTDVEDQSESNSCCANAAAGALEYLCKREAMETGDDVGDISRLFIYFVGRKNDQVRRGRNALVKDEGMTLVGAANALQSQGACLAKTWQFQLDNVNSRPPQDAFNEASNYKITHVERVPVDERAMKQCLAEGYPIVFGCKLTERFFNAPNGAVVTPDPNDPQSAEHGRHAMLIVGYSDSNQTFIVRNSWGPNYGDDGYCYMPYDYLCNPQLNMGHMWSARGMTNVDFTPEEEDDDNDLFDHTISPPDNTVVEYEVEEEDLGDDEDDPDGGDNDQAMFDPNSIFDAMFGQFDTDNSGSVSKSECKTLLQKLGVPWFLASAAFSHLDSDGSGTLSKDEFITAFGSLLGL